MLHLYMKEELKRKLFHLLALIYVAGVLVLPRPVFLQWLVIFLVADIMVETLRLRNPRFATFCHTWAGGLFRPDESKKMTAVFWMLLGVISAAVLIPSPRLAAAIYLFLIFGDGVASLVGKGFGGPYWPGSPKRISGSAACFLACLASGYAMLGPTVSGTGLVFISLAATFFEFGLIPLNDNLLIPLGTSLVIKLMESVGRGF